MVVKNQSSNWFQSKHWPRAAHLFLRSLFESSTPYYICWSGYQISISSATNRAKSPISGVHLLSYHFSSFFNKEEIILLIGLVSLIRLPWNYYRGSCSRYYGMDVYPQGYESWERYERKVSAIFKWLWQPFLQIAWPGALNNHGIVFERKGQVFGKSCRPMISVTRLRL